MATKRQKAIAARDRAMKKREAEQETAKLEQNFKRLQSMRGGFSRSPIPTGTKLKRERNIHLDRVEANLPAKADPPPVPVETKRLSAEMQAREDAAKEQFKLMQTRIAPAYNKGPDIYVSDGMLDDYLSGSQRRR